MDSSPPSPHEITLLEQQLADGTATPEIRDTLARAYHEAGQFALQQNRPADAQRALARYLRLAVDPKERRETLKQLQALVGDEPLVCEGCGRKSPIASAFEIRKEMLSCPRCRAKKPSSGGAAFWNRSLFWFLLLGVVALLTYPLQNPFHFWVSTLFILWLWFPLVIIIHESAHAVAALAMGGMLYGFHIGQGRTIWQKRVGTCDIILGETLDSGMARFGFATPDNLKARYFISIIAPLIVHLLICLAGLLLLDFDIGPNGYPVFQLFIYLNFFTFLFNVYPRMNHVNGWEHPSDGAILLRILQGRYSAEEIKLSSLTREILPLIHAKQYSEAQEILEKVLGYPDIPPIGHGITENNLAWVLLMTHQSTAALEHARRAYALLPWLPTVEGTFGATLVETGDLQSGIDLLHQAESFATVPEEHASYLAHLALGYAKLGNKVESQKYWEKALKLATNEETIAHVRPKLESIGY